MNTGLTCDLEAWWRQWVIDYPLQLTVACLCKEYLLGTFL